MPRKPNGTRPEDTPRAGVVRCLGPGREHRFRSPDRTRVRVCPACRRRTEGVTIPRVFTDPERDPNRPR